MFTQLCINGDKCTNSQLAEKTLLVMIVAKAQQPTHKKKKNTSKEAMFGPRSLYEEQLTQSFSTISLLLTQLAKQQFKYRITCASRSP